MTCISNFLIRPINFMLHAFDYMACGINFMLDILYSYLGGCCPISDFSGSPLPNNQISGKQLTKQLFYYSRPESQFCWQQDLIISRATSVSIVHKEVSIYLHSFGVRLAGSSNSNRYFSLDAIFQKLYSLCCSSQS